MKPLALAAGLLAAVAFPGLYAQTIDLRANIPFDFRVGETLMPAGEYLVHHSGGVLFVREESGRRKAAAALTIAEIRPNAPAQGALEFSRYGEAYFLAKIWSAYSQDGRALLKTALEKEFASRTPLVQTANIPVRPR